MGQVNNKRKRKKKKEKEMITPTSIQEKNLKRTKKTHGGGKIRTHNQ